jgi:hypothetical protein
MAEALGIAASIIAVLELTGKLADYCVSVRNASSDIREFAVEIQALRPSLTQLKFRVEDVVTASASSDISTSHHIATLSIPLEQLQTALQSVADKLGINQDGSTKARNLKQSLKWPFQRSQVLELLEKIERFKSLVNLALTDDILYALLYL